MRSRILHNEKGVAMLMAIVTMLLMAILAAELVYDTEVYHRMVFNQLDDLRAKYLAKSGLKIAILQLQAKSKAGAKMQTLGLGNNAGLVDMIWQTPLIFPPPVPAGLGPIEKEALEKLDKSLGLQGKIAISITGDSDKVNLNQLVWASGAATGTGTSTGTSTATSTSTSTQTLQGAQTSITSTLDQLIQNKKTEDEAFKTRNANVIAEVLVGNLVAWMNPAVTEDGNRHAKQDYYTRLPDPYFLKNAPLNSITELHMVEGFDDDIYKIVADNFTTLQTTGVNINKVPVTLLRGLIPALSQEEGDRLDKRRTDPAQGGNFSNVNDFWTFLNTMNNFDNAKQNLAKAGITLTTDENSYRVVVTATSGYATKTWVALVGSPPPAVAPPNGQSTATQTQTQTSTSTSTGTASATSSSNQLPTIIYLKAD